MRFAVDAHAIGRHLTGNEVYVRSLLRAFAELDRESEFFAYISGQGRGELGSAALPGPSGIGESLVELGWDLGRLVRRDRPDLLHVQYTAPLRGTAPVVVTVHDVSFLEHPEYFPWLRRAQLRHTVARTVKHGGAGSDGQRVFARCDPASLRHPAEKVRVVPNAAGSGFPRDRPRTRRWRGTRDGCGCAAPFVLSVGDLQPRKNQIGLIAAYRETDDGASGS